MPTASEIKKALKEAGLEIYRTRGEVVYLADRVRENLLMDAGTFVRGSGAAPIPPVGDGGLTRGQPALPPPVGDGGLTRGQPALPPPIPPGPLAVGFVVRAQRTDFPNDGEEHLFQRARRAAAPALGHGYREILTEVREVKDPGDGERTLDTWCEVSFEKDVGDLGAAVVEVRFALAIEKVATPSRGG